jgi:hypothetical protein
MAWHRSIVLRSPLIVIGSIGPCGSAETPAPAHADNARINTKLTMNTKKLLEFINNLSSIK